MAIKSLVSNTAHLLVGSALKRGISGTLKLGRHTITVARAAQPKFVSVANPLLLRSSPKTFTLQQRTVKQPTHQHALQSPLSGKA